MSGAILPFPQYAFMAWCSVKAQGQLYVYLSLSLTPTNVRTANKGQAQYGPLVAFMALLQRLKD
jgi:hypothetical protein